MVSNTWAYVYPIYNIYAVKAIKHALKKGDGAESTGWWWSQYTFPNIIMVHV